MICARVFYEIRTIGIFFSLLAVLCPSQKTRAQSRNHNLNKGTIDLKGEWLFRVDPKDEGLKGQWYKTQLPGRTRLPGSMTSNGKGDDITVSTPWTGGIEDSSWFFKPQYAEYRRPGNVKVPFWLQPVKYYKGAAWYQRTINIPLSWANKTVELFIERAHWETTVFVDDKSAGMRNSLAAPHRFEMKGLKPGAHVFTIRVDNRVKDIDVGINSHSISDHTQGNWNGMVGRIEIAVLPGSHIENVQLYPDILKKQVVARIAISSTDTRDVNLSLQAFSGSKWESALPPLNKHIRLNGNSDTVEVIYPMGKSARLWSAMHPSLYRIVVNLSDGKEKDTKTALFGMRSFESKGTQFIINGHPVMLRGTLDCAAFPLTGYPLTDVASWTKIFNTCKSYGLNHIRFHSWCPPEAAFEAADRVGMYFQIECSSWANQGASIGDGTPLDKYIYDESNRIMQEYGNHPSFCMLDYGNEPAGKGQTEYLTAFVKYWQKKDPRRLYTTGSGWPLIAEADYNSTADPRIQHWDEGLKSIINSQQPSTDYDWSAIIAKWQHPAVSHEIGQWCVYPDFKEMKQYTGVLKPKNFEIFEDQLKRNGLSAYAELFLQASGKLQVLCYKADIEAALRTRGFGGFQLLGLEDFPGQGTALVGVLSAFYRPKDYVTAAEYRQFCNSVVPLAKFPKMVYLNNERLNVPIEIAQFSEQAIKNAVPTWKITDTSGATLFLGRFKALTIPEGNSIPLGTIDQALLSVKKPQQLKLTVSVAGFQNSWDFFVYPSDVKIPDNGVIVTDHLDDRIISKLDGGAKVLLTIKKGSLSKCLGGGVAIGFSSIFWNTAWTHGQPPETLGILCDPKHPALKDFPTQGFSNYQWWDAMSHSSPVMLDSVKKGMKPIVRVIDDWVQARSLGLIFECKAGKGKLIVSGVDLLTDSENRPEARQLLLSLKNYMNSRSFEPKDKVDINRIKTLTQ